MLQDFLDAINRGQSRAIHILAWDTSEVGRPWYNVGQLARLAAGEVVLLQDGVRPQNLPGTAGDQPCPLL